MHVGLARTIYIYTVHYRIFDDIPAKLQCIHPIYVYGSGQPYIHVTHDCCMCTDFCVKYVSVLAVQQKRYVTCFLFLRFSTFLHLLTFLDQLALH